MNDAIATAALDAHVPPTDAQWRDARALVARFAQRWARPDADALRDLMHPDTRNLIPPMTEPADREGVVAHFRAVLERLPDLTVEVLRWAPCGDVVMIEWKARASVAGELFSWTGVDRFRLRGDRMIEANVYWDRQPVMDRMAAAAQRASTDGLRQNAPIAVAVPPP